MVVRTYESKDAIGAAAASLFAACVIEKPNAVLGLATGSTPIPTYQKMAELYTSGAVDYSGITTSAPSTNSLASSYSQTSWYLATH